MGLCHCINVGILQCVTFNKYPQPAVINKSEVLGHLLDVDLRFI